MKRNAYMYFEKKLIVYMYMHQRNAKIMKKKKKNEAFKKGYKSKLLIIVYNLLRF